MHTSKKLNHCQAQDMTPRYIIFKLLKSNDIIMIIIDDYYQ